MLKMFSKGKYFCVFCKHWYDPGNYALRPHNPEVHQWLVDDKAKNMCIYCNKPRRALDGCSHFTSKI